jgi:hypothetical protein
MSGMPSPTTHVNVNSVVYPPENRPP